MATNGNTNYDQYKVPEAPPSTGGVDHASTADGSAPNSNPLTKDEVGWYFVEQYYTTLSKTPEKLHLFYSKRSQFVHGLEAEVASTSNGRQEIEERVKQLDFQDCKVRVCSVDSQASFENIVVQVIGEISNKAAEPKKFVQTFVLAQQPSGYFVLNDIFRYIDESEEETADLASEEALPVAEPGVSAELEAKLESEPEPETEPQSKLQSEPRLEPQSELGGQPGIAKAEPIVEPEEPVADATAAETVTTKDPAAPEAPEEPVPSVATAAAATEAAETGEPAKAQDQDVATETGASELNANKAAAVAREIADEDVKQAEIPKDPPPTPLNRPAAAPEPARPLTWADRAAAALGNAARPVAAIPKPAVPTPPVRAPAPVPVPAAAPVTASATAAAAPRPSTPAAKAASETEEAPATTETQSNEPAKDKDSSQGTEWQTADSRRQHRSHQSVSTPGTKEGYVKYVSDKVKTEDLRAALTKFGELVYFDINRQKNCAFIEFDDLEGLGRAKSASPLMVNGERIVVDHRRYGSFRGRGRGGMDKGLNRDSARTGSSGGPRNHNYPRGGGGGSGGGGRGSMRAPPQTVNV